GAGNDIFKFNRGDGQGTMFDAFVSGNWEVVWDGATGWINGYVLTNDQVVKNGEVIVDGDNWLGRFSYDNINGTVSRYVSSGNMVENAGQDILELGIGIDIGDIQMEWRGDDLVLGINAKGTDAAVFNTIADTITLKEWGITKSIETFSFFNTGKLDTAAIVKWGGGSDGDDVIDGSSANDWLTGNGGNDLVSGGGGDDILNGNSGQDELRGGDGDDVLFGGTGNDILDGGKGKDILIGGYGFDIASYESATEAVRASLTAGDITEGAATDDVYDSIEGLRGSDYNDTLSGNEFENELQGGKGNDLLNAGKGDDTYFFERGDGQDVIHDVETFTETIVDKDGNLSSFYAENTTLLNEISFGFNNFFLRTYQVTITDTRSSTLVYDYTVNSFYGNFLPNSYPVDGWLEGFSPTGEGLEVIHVAEGVGDNGSDTLELGEGVSLSDLNIVLDGNDLLIELRGTTDSIRIQNFSDVERKIETLQFADGLTVNLGAVLINGAGTTADDFIVGDVGANNLIGNDGNDVLSGYDGNDTLVGGGGDDVLEGGIGADILDGGDGVDTVRYNSSASGVTINLSSASAATGGEASGDSFSSIENVSGSAYNDVITGNEQDNQIFGLKGDDTLYGGIGADVLKGDEGADLLYGGVGEDNLFGGDGNDILEGGADIDLLMGGSGADTLKGDTGNDNLFGEAGNDTLEGGSGDDNLLGGTGNDILEGGLGDDRYLFSANSGQDIISDSDGINEIAFDTDVSLDMLWMYQNGDDLVIEVIGGDTKVTLQGYYTGQTSVRRILTSTHGLYLSYADTFIGLMSNNVPLSTANVGQNIQDAYSSYWYEGALAAPVVDALTLETNEDNAINGQVIAVDHDDNIISYSVSGDPANGLVTMDVDSGSFTYMPDSNYQGTDSFIVRVTDANGASRENVVTVTVLSVNDAPTDILLSSLSVLEGDFGVEIGTLSSLDPDAPDVGDFDDASFKVDDIRFEVIGNILKLKDGITLDRNVAENIAIRVTATDRNGAGLSYAKDFIISVDDTNEAPTDITLSNDAVAENLAGGVIGVVTVDDPDDIGSLNNQHQLVVNDNRFVVENGVLKLAPGVSLDFEAEQAITLQITATDQNGAGLSLSRDFIVNVNDINEAPTNISLSSAAVSETAAGSNIIKTVDVTGQVTGEVNSAGTLIGTLQVTDPDFVASAFGQHQISVNDSRFEVILGQIWLKAGAILDYETEPTVALMVTATDGGGAAYSDSFILNIQDLIDIQVGGSGSDTLTGASGADIIYGRYGADTLVGGGGNDELYGEDGKALNPCGKLDVVTVGQLSPEEY
ncbi:MAG: Ig-like domain-containing protein, partial [Candidatus Marinimicrobia bacterium]|nr:Ig-like domain-containing protein [Candidatus Neomarinimicrobiota bacterium]